MPENEQTLEDMLKDYEEQGEEELADYTRDLIEERDAQKENQQ